jgi:hypothetical protein
MIPGVKPMIYIGVNIADDDNDNEAARYYFQDTVSYFWSGSVTSPDYAKRHKDIDYLMISHSKEELVEAQTLEDAIECMKAALTRERRA